jgi:hypothetical protein
MRIIDPFGGGCASAGLQLRPEGIGGGNGEIECQIMLD